MKIDAKEVLRPTITLTVICFVVAALLAGTNLLTEDKIAQQEEQAASEARELVLPGEDEQLGGALLVPQREPRRDYHSIPAWPAQARGIGSASQPSGHAAWRACRLFGGNLCHCIDPGRHLSGGP